MRVVSKDSVPQRAGESITWCEHAGRFVERVGAFDVLECTTCAFTHVVPLPTQPELADVYRHEYYDAEKPLYLERHREDQSWLRLGYEGRYRVFERELAPAALAPGARRILDVGSGPGFFLALGQERGWTTLGVEPSKQAAQHARGLGVEVIEEFLTPELASELGTFDAVHLNEVLEHLPDPCALLATCRSLLAPGGILCASVPNDYNPLQRVLRDLDGHAPWWVAPPHHLNFFDFRSLGQLLHRTGFEVIHEETSFPMELFLLMGDNFVGNDAEGRRCHRRRMRFERLLHEHGQGQLLADLYARLAGLGLGRHATLYARSR